MCKYVYLGLEELKPQKSYALAKNAQRGVINLKWDSLQTNADGKEGSKSHLSAVTETIHSLKRPGRV